MRWVGVWVGVMLLVAWASSGTLAPYAATTPEPVRDWQCGYLLNGDHEHFAATYRMLRGEPRESWAFSHMLHRMLYPLLAFPFMKWFGFLVGGFVANLVITAVAMFAFAWALSRRYGADVAARASALVATYPGLAYWIGLPYAHAFIVPGSLLAFVCLLEGYGAVIGLLCVGYDLIGLYGVALGVLRRWRAFAAFALTSLILVALVSWRSNDNTNIYPTLLRAYLHPLPGWGALLASAPLIFVENFFASGFFILPSAFLACAVWTRQALTAEERAVLLSVLALFVFLNLAPPYEGVWQMRGYWIPRLYQGTFVALIVYIARSARLVVPVVALQALLVFAIWPQVTGAAYYAFYQHAPIGTYAENLAKYGRRPIGFCQEQ